MPRICQNIGGAIICSSGRRRINCRWCGNTHTKLCDYPVGRRTCDAPICDEHASHVEGQNLDYCPIHKDRPNTQPSLLGKEQPS